MKQKSFTNGWNNSLQMCLINSNFISSFKHFYSGREELLDLCHHSLLLVESLAQFPVQHFYYNVLNIKYNSIQNNYLNLNNLLK